MIGIMLEHDFMIKKSICDTLVLTKRVFSGSDQIPLNTLRNTVRYAKLGCLMHSCSGYQRLVLICTL